MRRIRILAIGLLALTLIVAAGPAFAANPGSRLTTIVLTYNVETAQETFTGHGPGICGSGIGNDQDITYIEFAESFKIRMTKWLRCDDGSGDLLIELSAGEPVGSPRSGGWVVIDGTGAYERAVGGGTIGIGRHYPSDPVGTDTMTGVIVR